MARKKGINQLVGESLTQYIPQLREENAKLKSRIVLLEDALKLIATTGQPDKDGYISINKATFNLAKEALNQK